MRRGALPALSVMGATLVCASACSSLSGLSGGEERDATSNEETSTSSNDGGTSASSNDGSSEGSGTGPNLLMNGGFELGCAGWSAAFGDLTASSMAHTGMGSCQFCMQTNFEAWMSQTVNTPVEANATYYGEAWTMGASSQAALADAGLWGQAVSVVTTAVDGGMGDQSAQSSFAPVPATWNRISALVTTTQAGNQITFNYMLEQAGNPAKMSDVICVLVDDAVVQKVQ